MAKQRNAELLRKTADRIESIPTSYVQETFYREDDIAPCGAVACLAGEIVICAAPTVEVGLRRLKAQTDRAIYGSGEFAIIRTGEIAARLAGFTNTERRQLFDSGVNYWPAKFRRRYEKAQTARGRAGAAAALLRFLADGGKV